MSRRSYAGGIYAAGSGEGIFAAGGYSAPPADSYAAGNFFADQPRMDGKYRIVRAAGGRAPKGVRHCVAEKRVTTKKGKLVRRCADFVPGPRSAAGGNANNQQAAALNPYLIWLRTHGKAMYQDWRNNTLDGETAVAESKEAAMRRAPLPRY